METYSENGESLVHPLQLRKAGKDDYKAKETQQLKKENAVSANFHADIDQLAKILERGGLEDTWKEIAEKCYSCGSCNTTCPACFCFNMHDESELTGRSEAIEACLPD